ncbi:hypothetical protein NUW54_g980 [Trametes sanguinea]|uniref:Uncharacterized protein n=1 Tax=Trametes sanguinea TaxID=158606 RepID=A0ACC1Q9I4_9APHY|nr:hypothetical protein NUW54_g980 [Trametes sanguinea]
MMHHVHEHSIRVTIAYGWNNTGTIFRIPTLSSTVAEFDNSYSSLELANNTAITIWREFAMSNVRAMGEGIHGGHWPAVRPDDGAQAGPSSGHHGVPVPHTGNAAADVREVANIQDMRGRLMARRPFAAIRDHAMRNAVDRANRVINAVIQSVQGGAANLRA